MRSAGPGWALGALLCLVLASAARGHEIVLRVGRDNAERGRLVVAGVGQARAVCAPLYPGDDEFLGKWMHDQPQIGLVREDDFFGRVCRVLPGSLIGLRRVSAGAGLGFAEPSTFRPILTRDGEIYWFIVDERGGFDITLLATADRAGEHAATLQFVDLAGLQSESAPVTVCFRTTAGPDVVVYVCPMRCEGEKTYAAAGRCPVCGMGLADSRAHMDHEPKHGGTFFMAPDGRHHLEGTLERGEFRVFFYDEFTRPVSARGFGARAEIWRVGSDVIRPVGLGVAPGDAFQIVAAPSEIGFPLRVKLFVDFHDGAGEQVFDFEFEGPALPAATNQGSPDTKARRH